MKAYRLALPVLLCFLATPAKAVELRDGVLVPTYPEEVALLNECKKPNTCLIVTKEIVHRFAQAVADAQIQELKALVEERFAAAVEARAQEIAQQLRKKSL